jgi:hypothetical protein
MWCAMAYPLQQPSGAFVESFPASEDFHMTSRFPGPWQIAELPSGFAVHDANGRHLGFFYGRTDPNKAGHGEFLMIDDARQIAVDFAMLPELLNLISDRSEVATSKADDKLSRLETNRSPQGARETSRLLRSDGRRPPQMLRRPTDPRSILTEFLIPVAVAALFAGYLFFGDSDHPVNVAVVPQVTSNGLFAEFSSLQEAEAPLSKVTDSTVESPIEPELADSPVESPPNAQTAPFRPTVPLDIKPMEHGSEARPPPQKEGQSLTPSQEISNCFPSASAVRQNYPEGRPSWTLRAPGHEGTKCWYPAKETAPDTRRKETLQTKEELEVSR